jgi:DNA polymerase III epsilon subunit-like protein
VIKLFTEALSTIPIVVLDVETTGIDPWGDGVCQVAAVRFDGGREVGAYSTLVHPDRPIPAAATEIHGITDADVADAETILSVFARPDLKALLAGAAPAAYCAPFDRQFVPPDAFPDHQWPWIDPLTVVRAIDRYAKGSGRHKLTAACERHGIVLAQAHSAEADARAAGELFFKLLPKLAELAAEQRTTVETLGMYLRWQRVTESNEWFRFNEWLSKQPPREVADQ